MNFSVRVTGVVVGVVLVATACGGGSSAKPVAQPSVSSPPVVSATPTPVPTPVVTPTPVVPATPKSPPVAPKPAVVTPKPAAVVTLGVHWAPGATGYGTGRPSEIATGGDPSGSVSNITWTSWGGAQATGTGTASYGAGNYGTCTAWKAAHPGSPEDCSQRVPIVAYSLSDCNGHPGYHSIEWYFPLAGQTRDLSRPSYGLPDYDICKPYSSVVPTVSSPATPTAGSGVQRDVATKSAPFAADTQTKGQPQGYALAFANSDSVNVHHDPAVSASVDNQLAVGTYITVHCYSHSDAVVNSVGRVSDKWYAINLSEGLEGYVPSVFVDLTSGNSSWVMPACPAAGYWK